jgi:hypothetical protein
MYLDGNLHFVSCDSIRRNESCQNKINLASQSYLGNFSNVLVKQVSIPILSRKFSHGITDLNIPIFFLIEIYMLNALICRSDILEAQLKFPLH